jgi:hypothetical protein
VIVDEPGQHCDADGRLLRAGDFVRYKSRLDELFRIEAFQFPLDAIIENVLPGGRLGTSTVPCADLTRAINNPAEVAPAWFDSTYEEPVFDPLPGTVLPCGCHLRRIDFETALCPQHLIEVNG